MSARGRLPRWPYWALLVGLACIVTGPPAQARPPGGPPGVGVRHAGQLLQQGSQALDAGDAAAAEQALSDAYRAVPSTEALYLLGRAAWAQGRKTAGRDFLRRYLADPSTDADSPQGREAQRLLREPAEASGEVRVLGAPNAKVLVNDHIVGTLPLTLPLLLPAGTHKLTVESGGHVLEEQVKIVAGHSAEVRFRSETRVVLVTVPPSVAVLLAVPGAAPDEVLVLHGAVAQILRHAKLEPFHFELAPSAQPPDAACVESIACQRQLATSQAVDYVLAIRRAPGADTGSGPLTVTLLDPAVDELAARVERDCAACTGPILRSAVEEATQKALADGNGRPRGTLEVKSIPVGAKVWLGEQQLGVTPLSKTLWAGSYALTLRQPGYIEQAVSTAVEDGQSRRIETTLQPEPPKIVAAPRYEERTVIERRPRPLARLISGGVLVGLGAVGLGFGGSAVYYDGKCTPDGAPPPIPPGTCIGAETYHTGTGGGLLIGFGSAAVLTGTLLLAIPGRKIAKTVRVPLPAEPTRSPP